MHTFFSKNWAELFAQELGLQTDVFELSHDDKKISYSFLKKEINQLDFAGKLSDTYFDISSAYGYGGIYLSNQVKKDPSFLKDFEEKFSLYCKKKNIVTEFVRFHPLQRNHEYFGKFYTLKHVNDNAYVNLDLPAEDIIKNINKRHRYCIRKAIAKGVDIEVSDDFKKMPEFIKLYEETNKKNKADAFYYFSKSFFINLVKQLKGKLKLVLAYVDNQPVSAALFIFDEGEVYYFLSGTNKLGYSNYACHLLLYETILLAKKEGYKIFNLGGGIKRNDNLFLFKSGFSKTIAPYYIGTAIRNNKMYNRLIKLSKIDPQVDYFPKYRYSP